MSEFCLVSTTTGAPDLARQIARALLEQKLAACVQIMPITSHYVWEGEVREDAEQLLLIKAKSADYADVAAALRKLNSYDVPEILKIDVADGSADYLAWIRQTTR